MPKRKSTATPCPRGKPVSYASCCGNYHVGSVAPTAEALMRSRYSAYVLAQESYLLATWHTSTRPPSLDLAENGNTRWLGLEIKKNESTGVDTAIVEFVARNKIAGRA